VKVAAVVDWVQANRKWIAIGVAMVGPWIWMVGLDRILRRTR